MGVGLCIRVSLPPHILPGARLAGRGGPGPGLGGPGSGGSTHTGPSPVGVRKKRTARGGPGVRVVSTASWCWSSARRGPSRAGGALPCRHDARGTEALAQAAADLAQTRIPAESGRAGQCSGQRLDLSAVQVLRPRCAFWLLILKKYINLQRVEFGHMHRSRGHHHIQDRKSAPKTFPPDPVLARAPAPA